MEGKVSSSLTVVRRPLGISGSFVDSTYLYNNTCFFHCTLTLAPTVQTLVAKIADTYAQIKAVVLNCTNHCLFRGSNSKQF